MIRVRFLSDQVVKNHLVGTDRETRFIEGQVIDLREDSARHWLRRNLAEVVSGVSPGVPERDGAPPIMAGDGAFPESGTVQPSSASLPGQASQTRTSNTSDEPETTDDAKSSSSTEPTKKRSGRTSSTAQTRRGGAKSKTRRGLRVVK